MLKGSNAQRVLVDKAYASKANRAVLKGKHRDGILYKGGARSFTVPIAKAF
jgi:IS5 family transposase